MLIFYCLISFFLILMYFLFLILQYTSVKHFELPGVLTHSVTIFMGRSYLS